MMYDQQYQRRLTTWTSIKSLGVEAFVEMVLQQPLSPSQAAFLRQFEED